jgi:hypothetical protein
VLGVVDLHFKECVGLLVNDDAQRRNQVFFGQTGFASVNRRFMTLRACSTINTKSLRRKIVPEAFVKESPE